MATDRARVAVVLVRARNPQNIGAVARAMHDLGFADLRIVNEYRVAFEGAKSAVDASSVLDAAQEFASVADAVADCSVVLGTTAVGSRVLEHPLLLLPDAAPVVADATQQGRVALLFGSEKTGLTNDELSHCQALVTIPMQVTGGKHLSMNLGQAAAICLYALAQVEGASTAAAEPVAVAAEQERLTGLLIEVLEQSGYTRRNPANARINTVRRLTRRMALSADDAAVWTGMLRQLLRAPRD